MTEGRAGIQGLFFFPTTGGIGRLADAGTGETDGDGGRYGKLRRGDAADAFVAAA